MRWREVSELHPPADGALSLALLLIAALLGGTVVGRVAVALSGIGRQGKLTQFESACTEVEVASRDQGGGIDE